MKHLPVAKGKKQRKKGKGEGQREWEKLKLGQEKSAAVRRIPDQHLLLIVTMEAFDL